MQGVFKSADLKGSQFVTMDRRGRGMDAAGRRGGSQGGDETFPVVLLAHGWCRPTLWLPFPEYSCPDNTHWDVMPVQLRDLE